MQIRADLMRGRLTPSSYRIQSPVLTLEQEIKVSPSEIGPYVEKVIPINIHSQDDFPCIPEANKESTVLNDNERDNNVSYSEVSSSPAKPNTIPVPVRIPAAHIKNPCYFPPKHN